MVRETAREERGLMSEVLLYRHPPAFDDLVVTFC